MEIVFQNKHEDFDALYYYLIKETAEGKRLNRLVRWDWLKNLTLLTVSSGLLWPLLDRSISWMAAAVATIALGLVVLLLQTRFKPRYGLAIEAYRALERRMPPKELAFAQLKRTILASPDWLEVHSSEAIHRWRWRRVDKVSVMRDFIFVHVGNCPVIYIPKRDFLSNEAFIEFGKKLQQLRDTKKDEPMGTE